MSAIHKFIGIPYKFGSNTMNECDCFGLIELVYADLLGVKPDQYDRFHGKDPEAEHINNEFINRIAYEWTRTDTPKSMCMIAIDTLYVPGKNIVNHVGIYIDKNMILHTNKQIGFSSIEKLKSQYKVIGYYEFNT